MADPVIYAIDVGDANLRGGVYINGSISGLITVPTPHEPRMTGGSARLLHCIGSVIDQLSQHAPPMEALAVSASGIMTLKPHPGARAYGPFQDAELFVVAPNVDGLKYAPLVQMLEDLDYNVPIHVENDVNAALESDIKDEDAVCVALGAGLGAAAKKAGNVIHVGDTWSCFEIGHGMRWRLSEELSRMCHCGSLGCLEAAIGGWAMRERYGVDPQHASPDVYNRMREDVIDTLPLAIASVVRQTDVIEVRLAGKGCVGYAQNSDFVERIKARTEQELNGDAVNVELLDLGELAELQGSAMALLRHQVI